MNKAEKIHSLTHLFSDINLRIFTQVFYIFGISAIEYHYKKNLTDAEILNISKISN